MQIVEKEIIQSIKNDRNKWKFYQHEKLKSHGPFTYFLHTLYNIILLKTESITGNYYYIGLLNDTNELEVFEVKGVLTNLKIAHLFNKEIRDIVNIEKIKEHQRIKILENKILTLLKPGIIIN